MGTLYPEGSPARDGGFTIFYMGINLGAAMAPLLCGYVGETYGWHYGFGLATLGMLIGLAVFVVPTTLARVLILLGALSTAVAMVTLQDNWLLLVVNGFVALALAISGAISFVALGREGLPPEAGGPPHRGLTPPPAPDSPERAAYIRRLLAMPLLGTFVAVPVLAGLVWSNRLVTLIPDSVLEPLANSDSALVRLGGTLAAEISTPTGLILALTGFVALIYILIEANRSSRVERERLFVAVTLMFFSMLFWAFFEQAGSSLTLFADRNVDRNFLGLFEFSASGTQSFNPIFILFGGIFSVLWIKLDKIGRNPNIPIKFGLGLILLGVGFLMLNVGASMAGVDARIPLAFLVLMYLMHTVGELFLSPIGLSMVTKLAPKSMTGQAMGAWFLSFAFANSVAAGLAQLTGAESEGGKQLTAMVEAGEKILAPKTALENLISNGTDMLGATYWEEALATAQTGLETYVGLYSLLGQIAIGIGLVLILLSGLLTKMMHGVR